MATVMQAEIISASVNLSGSTVGTANVFTGSAYFSQVSVAANVTFANATNGTLAILINGVIITSVPTSTGFAASVSVSNLAVGSGGVVSIEAFGTPSNMTFSYSVSGADFTNYNVI